MKKKFWLTTLLSLTAAFTVACSTGDKATNTTPTSGNKDQFTYAISADPTVTNPLRTTDRWGLTYTNMIFSPLVRIEGDGAKKYELAKSLEPSADGKKIKVVLRDDVKWSDGEKFTADDVVYTYNQLAKKENKREQKMQVDGQPIKIVKVDDYTVEFRLPSASAAAIENVATETYILPEHVYSKVSDLSGNDVSGVQPVGTGPYKLDEYKRGEYIKLSANEHYFGGKASVNNVVLRIIPSSETTKVALQKGEVDAAVVLPSDVADLDKNAITAYPYSENRVGYLGLNANTDELKDVKVRQAIMFALNKEELNKAVYLDGQYYTTPNSFLPTANPFKTDDVEKYATNVEKAKSLLSEAGKSNLTLKLWYTGNDKAQTLQATLIQQQLKAAGINVELNGVESAALTAELKNKDSKAYHMFLNGYIWGNDPDLYNVMYTSNGPNNYFKLKSAKVDELFKSGAVELDSAKRKEIYNNLQKEIANEAVVYPIVDNKRVLAVNNRVADVEKAGLVPIYTFEDVSKLTIKQ
ncbi:MAG: ABC transporter substrate-binding protein [Gemella sp.]|nr:ABC transporter substrate-binding protein [Gemella sp.]